MALNWNFDHDYIGEIEFNKGCVYNLYSGNALMIAVEEIIQFGKEYYNVMWFAADIDHLNNMLGLTKDCHTPMFDSNNLHRVKLDHNYRGTKKIVNALVKYNQPITIELF